MDVVGAVSGLHCSGFQVDCGKVNIGCMATILWTNKIVYHGRFILFRWFWLKVENEAIFEGM